MSKGINSVLLVTHPTRSEALSTALELTKLLSAKKIAVHTTIQSAGAVEYKEGVEIDLGIVLGGDGTMLRAAQICRGKNVPILGINLGHVGFLAEIERPSLSEIAAAIADGSFSIEERMTLSYELHRNGKMIDSGWALNEVLVERNEKCVSSKW